MGNLTSKFNDHKRVNLFRLFFCGNEGTSLTLKILNGTHYHQVSSVVYNIKFISNNDVLEELLIDVRYNSINNKIMLNIKKTNDINNDLINNDYVLYANDCVIEIKEAFKNKYIISIYENNNGKIGIGSYYDHKIVGIIEFMNSDKNTKIKIYENIECIIKVNDSIEINDKMKFKLICPLIDNKVCEMDYFIIKTNYAENNNDYVCSNLVHIENNFILSNTLFPKIKFMFSMFFDDIYKIYDFNDNFEVY